MQIPLAECWDLQTSPFPLIHPVFTFPILLPDQRDHAIGRQLDIQPSVVGVARHRGVASAGGAADGEKAEVEGVIG